MKVDRRAIDLEATGGIDSADCPETSHAHSAQYMVPLKVDTGIPPMVTVIRILAVFGIIDEKIVIIWLNMARRSAAELWAVTDGLPVIDRWTPASCQLRTGQQDESACSR